MNNSDNFSSLFEFLNELLKLYDKKYQIDILY